MAFVELLIVEDAFEIEGRGLILVPTFPVPDRGWTARVETILLVTPEGQQMEAQARMHVSHFNIRRLDTTAAEKWRVTLCIQGIPKLQIPAGSRVLVDDTIKLQLIAG